MLFRKMIALGTLLMLLPAIAIGELSGAPMVEEVKATFAAENMWLWNGAVRHVHFSDIDADPMDWTKLRSLHPGEGRIDFSFVCEKLKAVGYADYITIESTSVTEDGSIETEKLNNSLARIREYMK